MITVETDRGLRTHLLHARRAVHRALDGKGDQGLDVFGRETGRLGLHNDLRRRELGENVHGHPHRDITGGDEEHDQPDDDEQAILQRPVNDFVEHGFLALVLASRYRLAVSRLGS
jgi:hypothetical protein